MSLHVFISHSSEDREIAQQVCDLIEARGLRCWIAPRNITPGHAYAEEIVDAIHGAGALVLVLTENANASKFVAKEVERAVDMGRPVIPLRVREVKPGKSLELFISSSHWIDAFTSPMEAKMDQLEAALRPLCDMAPAPPRPANPAPKPRPAAKKDKDGTLPVPAIVGGVVVVAALAVGGMMMLGGEDEAAPVARTEAPETAPAPAQAAPQAQAQPQALAPTPATEAPAAQPASPGTPVALPGPALAAAESELVQSLAGITGGNRTNAIRELAPRLPADLSDGAFVALLGPLEGRDYTRAVDFLANHKQTPLSLEGLAALARPLQAYDRSWLFERLGKQDVLPRDIAAAQAADLMRGLDGRARRDAIAALAPRLQPVVGEEALNQVANPLMGAERASAFATLAKQDKLGEGLRGSDVGPALREGAYRPRMDMIATFAPYLAADQTVDDVDALLGPLSGYERVYALTTLRKHDRIAKGLPVEGVLGLMQGLTERPRREAIDQLAPQIAGPIGADAMVALAGPLGGYERVRAYTALVKAGVVGQLSEADVTQLREGIGSHDRDHRDLLQALAPVL